jgi:hypothetical protein
VKANAAIVRAGESGAVSVFTTNATNFVVDINGYVVPTTNAAGLSFYSLAPCCVADTRNPVGPLGGPALVATQQRSFPVPSSVCNVPVTAKAYSVNFTVVPKRPLGYLSVWPTGQAQPLVSTLNSPGVVTANAAIVPAGANGAISLYASNNTDVVIDINGYFAPASANGLSFYAAAPCRPLDTRTVADLSDFQGTLSAKVVGSDCGIPSAALAFLLNSTVVPSGPLGFLTLWPDGQTRPLASTLNAPDGAVTSNMAIVPSGKGSVGAFGTQSTNLILDLAGYFAP